MAPGQGMAPGPGSAALEPAGPPDTGRGPSWPPGFAVDPDPTPDAARRAAIEARAGRLSGAAADGAPAGLTPAAAPKALDSAGDVRAARAGAIAAYRAGARAAARVQEARQNGRTALPAQKDGTAQVARPGDELPAAIPPGRIADPYGVRGTPRRPRPSNRRRPPPRPHTGTTSRPTPPPAGARPPHWPPNGHGRPGWPSSDP
ncbi:hypothetical protein SHKM778_10080 [Streptomyces sp. KM77-8]|uniref:Uncharacterized protein n=1 Tax=Streptomyces haneummycinicus TaxID=3074435 RepID=A0AAT9HB59_9ACTN